MQYKTSRQADKTSKPQKEKNLSGQWKQSLQMK